MNFNYYCSNPVEREQLATISTPPATRSFQPIAHHRLVDLAERSIDAIGWRIVTQHHGIFGDDGARYFGLLELANGASDSQTAMVLGIRNSHDHRFSASFALGNGVMVCDNLDFSGEITLARKHTRYIERDLPNVVSRAIGELGDFRQKQTERIACYRETGLTDSAANDCIIDALDKRVLPASAIPAVLKQWREPDHPEFEDRNAWSLFNGFTEVLKQRGNLPMLPNRTKALHGILDSTCKVLSA